MALITFFLADGRKVEGGVPFNRSTVNGAVTRVEIDHPTIPHKIVLFNPGSGFILFNSVMQMQGLKLTSTVIGALNGDTAEGYRLTPEFISFTPINLEKVKRDMSPRVFIPGG